MPTNPCHLLPGEPGTYVGYHIERDLVWVAVHEGTTSSTLYLTPKRAMDLADAIYDHVTLRSFQRMTEADDE